MKTRFWAFGMVLVVIMMLIVPQVIAQDSSTDTIEFTGEITAIENDGTTLLLTVGGFTVDATSAEINVALAVTTLVKVHGTLLDDGTVAAREINAPEVSPDDGSSDPGVPVDELELIGTLDSLSADVAVVSGVSFDVSGAEVQADLVVDDIVKVHASFDAVTATWIARELVRYTGDDLGLDDAGLCTFEIKISSASLRSGPGTGYDVIGFAFHDDRLPVLEVHNSGAWIKVTAAGGEAWLAVSTGELDGDCSALAISSMQFVGADDDHHGDDGSTGDDDGPNHDANDDHGDDGSDHDIGDDHGDDGSGHDSGDDHGGDHHSDDSSDDD